MSAGDWKEMYSACQAGDIALVKYYLDAGIDPNFQHPEFGTTVLIESVRQKQADIVRLLVENGAEPHLTEDWSSDTAMSVAEAQKDEAVLAALTHE